MSGRGRAAVAAAILTTIGLIGPTTPTAGAAGAPAGPATPVALQTTLTGLREIGPRGGSGAGDLDGVGAASLSVQAERLCFALNVSQIDLPAAAAHVHAARKGVNGPIVVPLVAPDADGRSSGCVEDVDAAVLDGLAADPDGYYVNVHTAAFPAGAVRGQLKEEATEGDLQATVLTGADEIGPTGEPGAGDPDGTGMATVAVSSRLRRVCAELSVRRVARPAVAAHIHAAPPDANGPIVVPLPTPAGNGTAKGCVRGLDQALVDAIVEHPSDYYVNVHTSDFPAGALRGQLGPAEWVTGGGSYADADRWLCLPQRAAAADPCQHDLDTTVVAEDGTLTVVPHVVEPDPSFDCFYVYPTVRLTDEGNGAFDGDYGNETFTARLQAARFNEAGGCRVFAPVYRQRTLSAPNDTGIDYGAIAYADVVAAFRHYIAHENDGRPFVLMGHSQGSGLLRRLIADEVERWPSVLDRLVSALLLGSTVAVPEGGDVGGSFQHVPACRSADQAGCVVSYASFRDTAPPTAASFFARDPGPGLQALCTNPAALGGGRGEVSPHYDIVTDSGFGNADPHLPWADDVTNPPTITTPFVALPGLVTTTCVDTGTFNYLALHVEAGPGPRADDIAGDLTPEWGMHLVDVNVALRPLVELTQDQAAAWAAAR